jgi:alkylation response protein AidB-like acyl-CoA dehydrogenase
MNKPLASLISVDALAAEFAGEAARYDREGSFPTNHVGRLWEAGLLTLATPKELGGRGAGLAEASAVVGRIARGCPASALVLSMQYLQHSRLAAPDWPRHLAARVADDALAGPALINALRVEPELGSPSRGGLPQTTARRDGERWLISGHKIYATGIPVLRWLAVWARTDEAEPRVGTFLVPAAAPGIRIVESWDHLGLRASGSHDVVLDEVAVPLDHEVDVRRPQDWLAQEPEAQAWSAAMLASLYDGVARAARDWFVGFAKTRTPAGLGAPLATLPRFQEAIGEIERLLAVNERLIRSLAQDVDQGARPAGVDSGIVKMTVSANAIAAVEQAVALAGNPGLTRANPLERHLRDVLCARIHTPQDDSVRAAAGRRALGL